MHMEIESCAIKQIHGHYEVYINGRFYCCADTYTEAAHELELYEAQEGAE